MFRTVFRKKLRPAQSIMGMILLPGKQAPTLEEILQPLANTVGIKEVRHPRAGCMFMAQFLEYKLTIAHLPAPVPGNEIATLSGQYTSRDPWVQPPSTHASHLMVNLSQAGSDPLRENYLFSDAASKLLRLPQAMGVYLHDRSLLLPKSEFLQNMQGERLPLANWIFFGSHRSGKLRSAYTIGLNTFGMLEIEIVDSYQEFENLAKLMQDVVHYILKQNIRLKDGESISHPGSVKLQISEAKGVFTPGKCIRIRY